MEAVNTKEAAEMLNISVRRVLYLLQQRRIRGAYKVGRAWWIPLYCGKPKVSRGKRGPTPRWGKPRRSTAFIRVNRQVIARNSKQSQCEPVISVKQSGQNIYGHEARIKGPCRIIYRPEEPKDGARLWIETHAEVEVILNSA